MLSKKVILVENDEPLGNLMFHSLSLQWLQSRNV